jgi:hypothetical protein
MLNEEPYMETWTTTEDPWSTESDALSDDEPDDALAL